MEPRISVIDRLGFGAVKPKEDNFHRRRDEDRRRDEAEDRKYASRVRHGEGFRGKVLLPRKIHYEANRVGDDFRANNVQEEVEGVSVRFDRFHSEKPHHQNLLLSREY